MRKLQSLIGIGLLCESLILFGCTKNETLSSSSSYMSYNSSLSSSSSNIPEKELFTNKVVLETKLSSADEVFKDYDGILRSFNYLLDRSITIIATSLVERLEAIYGTKAEYDIKFNGETILTWNKGNAISSKYTVNTNSSNGTYVFLLDDNGNYTTGDRLVYCDATNRSQGVVYYRNKDDNNILLHLHDPATMVLVSYLTNNEVSDTYSVGTDSDIIDFAKLTVLYGTMYGDNYYEEQSQYLRLLQNTNNVWSWAEYFEDNTAVDRLKYALALIVSGKDNSTISTMVQVDIDDIHSAYTIALSSIDTISNFATSIQDKISDFVLHYVIGNDLVSRDDMAMTLLDRCYEYFCEYTKTAKYTTDMNDVFLTKTSILDVPEINKRYTLLEFLADYNDFYTTDLHILNNSSFQTLSDAYDYLISEYRAGSLKFYSDSYEMFNNEMCLAGYIYYRGVDGSGYIDDGIKSFDQIVFPFTLSEQVGMRNVKNYKQVLKIMLSDIAGITIDNKSIFLDTTKYSATSSTIEAVNIEDIRQYSAISIALNDNIADSDLVNIANYELSLSLASEKECDIVITAQVYGSYKKSQASTIYSGKLSGDITARLTGLSLSDDIGDGDPRGFLVLRFSTSEAFGVNFHLTNVAI